MKRNRIVRQHPESSLRVGYICILNVLNVNIGGNVDKDLLVAFIKEMKNGTNLTDEEIAQLAATKIAESKPKSRM